MMLDIFEICYIEIICVDVDAHVAVRTKCNYIIHCLVSQTFWRSVADTYMHLSKKYNWNRWKRKKKPRRFLRWQIDLFQQRNSQGQNQFLRRFIMGNLVTFFIKKSLSTHRPIFNIIVRVLFCCFSSFQMSARPHFPTYNLLPTPMIFLQCQPQLPAGQSDKRKGCMNVHVRMHSSQFPTL